MKKISPTRIKEKLKTYLADGTLSEEAFESQVKGLAQWGGWLYYHTYRSQHSPSGFPDSVLVKPPRLIFAELKSENGEVSADQQEWLDALARCPSTEVCLWRPSDFEAIKEVLFCTSKR